MKNQSLSLFTQLYKLNSIYHDIENFLSYWKKEKLTQLVIPPQSKKYEKIISFIQWIGLFATTTGGILTLNGYRKIGGSITAFFPLFGAFVLFFKEKNETRKRKWENFVAASEKLGRNLDELIIVVTSLQNFSFPTKVKKELENLRREIYELLKEYDKNRNQKIDTSELKIKKLAHDLRKKWRYKSKSQLKSLREIVLAIRNLQKEMTEVD